ncbi:hypothetical protein [Kitasatospora griseola]|uniref:hypothetical protein n=1 Tax=Kitasatospora griseola TaxID=2064 RepID=UPI00381AFC7A
MIGLPDAAPRLVLPIAALMRDDGAALPAASDGTAWEDGLCWLSCGQWTGVASVGLITMAGATAPMFACASCTRRLRTFVRGHQHRTGTACGRAEQPPVTVAAELPALDSAPGEPRARARHRRPRPRLWRRCNPRRAGR